MERWIIPRTFVLLFILFSIIIVMVGGWNEDTFRWPIRLSARMAVIFFCLAFGASAFHYFYQNWITNWILRNRKYLGVTFAIIHILHLGTLVVLQYAFHPVFSLAANTSLLAGGLAYFFTVGMLITSFPQYKELLPGRTWHWFHTIGGYWIWIIFTRTYSKAMFRNEYEYLPILILLLIVLIFRIAKLNGHYRNRKLPAT